MADQKHQETFKHLQKELQSQVKEIQKLLTTIQQDSEGGFAPRYITHLQAPIDALKEIDTKIKAYHIWAS